MQSVDIQIRESPVQNSRPRLAPSPSSTRCDAQSDAMDTGKGWWMARRWSQVHDAVVPPRHPQGHLQGKIQHTLRPDESSASIRSRISKVAGRLLHLGSPKRS